MPWVWPSGAVRTLDAPLSTLKCERMLPVREVEIVANANSAAKAEVAGEVAKAFRDGLAYGKDLFREIRAIH